MTVITMILELPPPASGICRVVYGCDDSYVPNLVGKTVASVRRSFAGPLDIWPHFGQARRDSRFSAAKRKLKKRLWGWGWQT
jgi:hypothetical protein